LPFSQHALAEIDVALAIQGSRYSLLSCVLKKEILHPVFLLGECRDGEHLVEQVLVYQRQVQPLTFLHGWYRIGFREWFAT